LHTADDSRLTTDYWAGRDTVVKAQWGVAMI